jgi:hypothetical protein
MKPVTQDGTRFQGGGFAHQNKKRRLKRVVGVSSVSQDAATNTQHHGTVPAHQNAERLLVSLAEELCQKLAVGLTLGVVRAQRQGKL